MTNVGSGACGFNSYCIINGDKPNCLCPDHFSPIDPDDIINQGCKPNFEEPSCDQYDPADYELVEMHNANWPNGDYEKLSPMDVDGCRQACMNDCRCLVAVFGFGDCWKKKMPLSNGRVDPSTGGLVIFKVSKSSYLNASRNSSTDNGNDNKTRAIISLSAILGGSVLINFIAITSTILLLLSKRRKLTETKTESIAAKSNLQVFSYAALEKATEKFKDEVGKGSFGSVYKGVLVSQGGITVAVKKLNGMAQQGEKEFIAELTVIGRTHHKNLVQLIGFCDEGSHRLLVYEFMSNGTLASYLFQIEKPRWEKRVQMAYGVARGLSYLHDECSNQIIHCDIKPQNILLDDYLTARISDFGLAKLLMTEQTRTKTSIRGTKGYVAPEWFKDKAITSKVDVYSFGVVLLEIICCRKNVEKDFVDDERIILTDWAYECYTKSKLEELVQYDEDAITDHRRLERFVAVAIWCIQEEPSMRPSMKKVTQMLEGAVAVPLPPDPSSFISSIN
ncbi:G-type lectin S-receptor-like serine/threonine-protein kinase LECRK3 [Phalaenopsis equestris]|uniref:G-type lectin S-receptor-like serine/threonine-protein kinase LECRK3 n=1 Tax=Phalaenopsis equestris TaxID=78828 RepID=UPI0009E3DFBC|nr:G-type lectin S-receptor-like serine/threonine-protein kinase LECRK3 [Phalaenopsis equestris]